MVQPTNQGYLSIHSYAITSVFMPHPQLLHTQKVPSQPSDLGTLSRAVDPMLPAQPYPSSGWFNRSEGLKGNCSMAWRDLLKPIP